ncbi:MAG: Ribosome-binding factor [Candidatus Parcubacteria bacterium]|nr:Ribosome-binding factor [Candidatus Parcubacteria bacterium]
MSDKDAKLQEMIRELAADFFSRESNRQSLLTVTAVEVVARGSVARILITVIPESEEEKALGFAHRQLTDFKHFVMEKSRIQRIPFFEVALDKGEKNRQRLDEITKKL